MSRAEAAAYIAGLSREEKERLNEFLKTLAAERPPAKNEEEIS